MKDILPLLVALCGTVKQLPHSPQPNRLATLPVRNVPQPTNHRTRKPTPIRRGSSN